MFNNNKSKHWRMLPRAGNAILSQLVFVYLIAQWFLTQFIAFNEIWYYNKATRFNCREIWSLFICNMMFNYNWTLYLRSNAN